MAIHTSYITFSELLNTHHEQGLLNRLKRMAMIDTEMLEAHKIYNTMHVILVDLEAQPLRNVSEF